MPTRRFPRARRAWWWVSPAAAVLVVEGAGAGAGGERAEGPSAQARREAFVAGVAGEDDVVFAGGDGDG